MTNNISLPDYDNSILGIPNSILQHYGAETHHKSLPLLDDRLRQNYKNVVLYVLDGLGVEILQAHAPNGFLLRNLSKTLSSVYPCTTTSALTSLETGLTPLEHGWLGWSQYFAAIDKSVDLFSNRESGTSRLAAENNIVWETIGYKNLFEQIREVDAGIEFCRVSPFGKYKTSSNEDVCSYIAELSQKEGRRYIYAYHFQPDQEMHCSGCFSELTKSKVLKFDRQIEELATKLKDTLLIVTADHGMVDIEDLVIEDYPEINNCLAVLPTREPRSLSFFVKPEYKSDFPRLWESHFADAFELLTGEEAFASGLFGSGKAHDNARDFLGDYVALATGNLGLWFKNEDGQASNHKAAHAGLNAAEMQVPLVLIES